MAQDRVSSKAQTYLKWLKSAFISEKADEPENPRRRQFLDPTVLISTALLSACGSSTGFLGSNSRRAKEDPAQPQPQPSASNPTPEDPGIGQERDDVVSIGNDLNSIPGDIETQIKCSPLGLDTVATQNIEPSSVNFTIKFYGSRSSTMMVIGLNNYFHLGNTLITHINLVRPGGKIIGTHAITSATIASDFKLVPIVMDHINFKDDSAVLVVMHHSDGSQTKHEQIINYETSFRGLETVAATPISVDPEFFKNQGIANFNHNGAYTGFVESNDPKHVFSGRKLKTAQSNAVITPSSGLNGFVITDLLGNELNSGNRFNDILNHPTFIAYKLQGGRWYRTMIRVG